MKSKRPSSYPIREMAGIDAIRAQKLRAFRIRTTTRYLEKAKTPRGRKALADLMEISASEILRLANKADLMRIKGIGDDYTELLFAAGVDTVRELRLRKPSQLAQKMVVANETAATKGKKLVRLLPSEKTIQRWIEQAKTLPLQISY